MRRRRSVPSWSLPRRIRWLGHDVDVRSAIHRYRRWSALHDRIHLDSRGCLQREFSPSSLRIAGSLTLLYVLIPFWQTPATSNCQTKSSISNGVTELAATAAATNAPVASGSASASGTNKSASAGSAAKTGAAAAGSSAASSDGGKTSSGERRWMFNRELEVVVAASAVFLAGGLGVGAVML